MRLARRNWAGAGGARRPGGGRGSLRRLRALLAAALLTGCALAAALLRSVAVRQRRTVTAASAVRGSGGLRDETTQRTGPPALSHVCRPQPWVAPAFELLWRAQHPPAAACSAPTSRFMMAGEPMQWDPALRPEGEPSEITAAEGYGSVMTTVAQSLALSAPAGFVLVLNASQFSYGGAAECAARLPPERGRWDCAFEPMSTCSHEHALAAQAQDAAAPESALPARDRLPWLVRHGRYVHKDVLRALPDDAPGRPPGAMRLLPFHALRVPAEVAAHFPGGSAGAAVAAAGHAWLSALRAYLHALALPSMTRQLGWYGGLPGDEGTSDGSSDDLVGVHVRERDRGGGGAALEATWRRHADLVGRLVAERGVRRLLVATDSDEPDRLAALVAATAESLRLVSYRVLPRRFVHADPLETTAVFLEAHPEHRLNATLDVYAAADALGRCGHLVGRHTSTLLRLAAALRHARGCAAAAAGGNTEPATTVWSVDAGGPVALSLEDDGFQLATGDPG